MNRKRINNQAASYALAGLFLFLLVAFIAFDLNAVRREAFVQYDSKCSVVAPGACSGHAASTFGVFRGF